MKQAAIKPSLSLRFIKSSLNLLLVSAALFMFAAFWLANIRKDLYDAYIGAYSLGLTALLLFAGVYVCRLAVLWQMRVTTASKRASTRTPKSRAARRKLAAKRKPPYAIKPSDWVIEISAIIWAAALFLYLAFEFFRLVIPLGFNNFN